MKKITNFKLFVTEMDKTQKSPGRDIEDEDVGKKQIHLGPKSLIKARDLKNLDAEANKALVAAYNKTPKAFKQKKSKTS